MLTLLKILVFGGVSLLTPDSIDIVDATTLIQLNEPITAITQSAAIELDVSRNISADNSEAAALAFPLVFPESCVSALLHSKFGLSVYLDKVEGQWRDGKKILRLSATNGVVVDANFHQIELHTCTKIHDTKLTWHNYERPEFLL